MTKYKIAEKIRGLLDYDKDTFSDINRYICRAKDIYTGEWVYGYYVVVPEEYGHNELVHAIFDPNECKHIGGGEYKDYGWYEVDPDTVCSCTGVKDKNGKDIFEGDIVHGNVYMDGPEKLKSYIVCLCRYAWTCKAIRGDYEASFWIYTVNCEIIGNVYDNPELMED